MFDPNIRATVGPLFSECVDACDILRLSSDDCNAVLSELSIKTEQDFVNSVNKRIVIITDINGANLYINQRLVRVDVQKIAPVNTIGAGDSFNSGFLYTLQHLLKTCAFEDISEAQWITCVVNGITCAHEVCMSEAPRLPQNFRILV